MSEPKKRILILDTYYPEVVRRFENDHPEWGTLPYEEHLQAVLNELFGTADFYSRNLRLLGWEATDLIANYRRLQGQGDLVDAAMARIRDWKPDVLFLQDCSFVPPEALDRLRGEGVYIAGQLSCPMPPVECVRRADVIFTSFPHYVERLRVLGVPRVVFSPLACEPSAIERTLARWGGGVTPERDIDVLFVGGVGKNVHWRQGTEVLERVAEAFGQRFRWYGYGQNNLEPESPLRMVYHGEAWGVEMYKLLLRAKVVVNRHGEVAEGYANNMRMFEATSAGALLATEYVPNLDDFFVTNDEPGHMPEVLSYVDAEDLIDQARYLLDKRPDQREVMASKARARVMAEHTYYKKMQQISAVLHEEFRQ